MAKTIKYRFSRDAWRYIRVIVPVVVLWQVAAMLTANRIILPAPTDVYSAFVKMLTDGTLIEATWISVKRLMSGYIIGALIAVPLGVAVDLSSVLRASLTPNVEILRPIAGIAWIPLALVLFGIGHSLVLFIIVYGAIFPILINSISAVLETNNNLILAARTFGLTRFSIVRQVILPASMPTIFTGLEIGLGTAWMSLVAAELIGGSSGLGYLLTFARQLLETAEMIGAIVVIGVLGFSSTLSLRGIRRFAIPWAV